MPSHVRLVLAAALLSPALAFAACSSSSEEATPTPSAPDADTTAEASTSSSSGSPSPTPEAGPDNQTCSTLAQSGSMVDIVAAKPPQPDPTGGTPTDGTYVLTSVRAFTTLFPEGTKVQPFGEYTLVIGGGATTFDQVVMDKDGAIKRARGALAHDGTSFTGTPDCQTPLNGDGGVDVIEGHYSADATTLKMYVVRNLGITAELTFQKQ